MNALEEKTIGQIVAEDYRSAEVFAKFGIDFCCKGNRDIGTACSEKNLNPDELRAALDAALQLRASETTNYQSWPLDLLADYIEKKHHRYVEEKAPALKQYLNKINKVHGANHPELQEVYDLFVASTGELAVHMKKEELILFPYVRKMVQTQKSGESLKSPHFGTVKNPIQSMMSDHENEGERFRRIEELTDGYTPPEDACGTYKVSFALLKEFQDDLHLHIHLENNILFPKAEKLETSLLNNTV